MKVSFYGLGRGIVIVLSLQRYATASAQFDPTFTTKPSSLTVFDDRFYTNLGSLPTYSPAPTCFQLTAAPDYSAYGPSHSESSDKAYDTTNVFAAGFAWSFKYVNQYLLSTSSSAVPPSDCFPTNFFNYESIGDYNAEKPWTVPYYSPALACPTRWTIARQSTITSRPLNVSSGTAVEETTALCCPQGGWRARPEPAGACVLNSRPSTFTVSAYLDTEWNFRRTPLLVSTAGVAESSPPMAEEVGLQIRWQASDLKAETASSKATTSASTDMKHSTAVSHVGTSVNLISKVLSLVALLTGGAALLL